MRFDELEPEWLRVGDAGHIRDEGLNIATAQGVMFLCPKCFARNRGPVGTHSVLIWFRERGVPADRQPAPARWSVEGNGFHDLTLSPSVDLTENDPTEWHGHVLAGQVTGV